MVNKISVIDLTNRVGRARQAKIQQSVGRILKILNKKNVSVAVYLAKNSAMKILNRRFRGKNKTANVLSFKEPRNFPHPELHDKSGQPIQPIGEIYLNVNDVLRKNSNNRLLNVVPYTLITKLIIHSLLHLFGYHHQKKSDRIKMEKMEQKILQLLQ